MLEESIGEAGGRKVLLEQASLMTLTFQKKVTDRHNPIALEHKVTWMALNERISRALMYDYVRTISPLQAHP